MLGIYICHCLSCCFASKSKVQVLQPAVRRWLSHLKYWRALQEREKELKEEQAKRRRYRIHRDEDEEQVKKPGFADQVTFLLTYG